MFRNGLAARPRQVIHRALTTPHDYLDCTCCRPPSTRNANGVGNDEDDGDDGMGVLAPSLPDSALLYQLTLESASPLINLSDLLTAFEAVKTSAAPVNGGSASAVEKEVMPAFQLAVAELVYLGLLKRTGKKPDHVARGVWAAV